MQPGLTALLCSTLKASVAGCAAAQCFATLSNMINNTMGLQVAHLLKKAAQARDSQMLLRIRCWAHQVRCCPVLRQLASCCRVASCNTSVPPPQSQA